MEQRTIRELGGEIWAELEGAIQDAQRRGEPTLFGADTDWEARSRIIDLVMAVLARHEGKVIVNDKDLPVKPLPNEPRPGSEI